jgi:putative redox protein
MPAEKNATVVWQGKGLEFEATTGPGFSFTMHSPSDANGATPMEFLLAGVAGCTSMDVISILEKKRQKVHGLETHIHGVQAESAPNVYTDVTISFVVRGEDIDPVAVERAIELSHTKYCSASIMFERSGANVKTEYRIEEVAPASV